jgi:hypothetical protein
VDWQRRVGRSESGGEGEGESHVTLVLHWQYFVILTFHLSSSGGR